MGKVEDLTEHSVGCLKCQFAAFDWEVAKLGVRAKVTMADEELSPLHTNFPSTYH